jgi:hypothetical protein
MQCFGGYFLPGADTQVVAALLDGPLDLSGNRKRRIASQRMALEYKSGHDRNLKLLKAGW